jgi:ubiquinone/menaquinone biosynthesis C-methylase UbiE
MEWTRTLLSRPDEGGNLTSDLFRLIIRDRVRQLITKNHALLLDIGCGEGLLHEKIVTTKNDLKIFGIDTNHESLEIAKNRFPKKCAKNLCFLRASAQNLPFRDSSFNIVVCINTFYNFSRKEDVISALIEMARVCKREGFIIFDVRNKINPLVYLGFKWVWLYDTQVTLRAYSLRELTTVLVSKGMVVKKIVPVGFPLTLFAPIILVKIAFPHIMKRKET